MSKRFLICISLIMFANANAETNSNNEHQDLPETPIRARSVTSTPVDQILAISQRVDELVLQDLAKQGQKPNAKLNDEVFVRRVYLDVVGRIPTYEETSRFLNSKHKLKRQMLIDELLDSKGFESHFFNYWADLLRIKTRLNRQIPGQPYIDFVKESLAINKPYDQFVREMLQSEGPLMERDNGAVGYYLRDFQMPEDNMSNTVRVFLGTRLECAQCHDHPFDKWTQRDYFEMVAFTGGMQNRMPGPFSNQRREIRKLIDEKNISPQLRQAIQRITRPLSYGVVGSGTGLARLPDTYQYDDGEPNEIVTAKTMFEHESLVEVSVPKTRRPFRQRRNQQQTRIPGAREVNSREAYAQWLTSENNPRFSTVIANRLWKKLMGVGVIEPVDDINDYTVPVNPELMDYLAAQMVALEFDLKQYMRAILNSSTYQREASAYDTDGEKTFHFPGPVLRRMSAEQMWDSLLTLTIPDLDERQGPANRMARAMYGTDDIYLAYEELQNKSFDEIIEVAEKQLETRNDPKKRRQMFREMMAGQMNASGNSFMEKTREIRKEINELRSLAQRARKNRNFQNARSIQEKINKLNQEMRHMPGRTRPDMVRASELTSPARAGHFLREFGQSDREQIEAASGEFAVTQALSLMNGFVEKNVVANPRTELMRNVVAADTTQDKVHVVFLSMLHRQPTRGERTLWMKEGAAHGMEAAKDLIWTLSNSAEFIFIQ